MGHAFSQRGFHGRLAPLFERLYRGWRIKKILGHIAAAAERRIEFLHHQKNFAVVSARCLLRLDVYRAYLAAVLSGGEVRPSAVVRMIKSQSRRPWRKNKPAHSMRCNIRRALLRGAIHVSRYLLAVPMQLLGRV